MGVGWAKKRFVVYENLITSMKNDDILAIIGHEIGKITMYSPIFERALQIQTFVEEVNCSTGLRWEFHLGIQLPNQQSRFLFPFWFRQAKRNMDYEKLLTFARRPLASFYSHTFTIH